MLEGCVIAGRDKFGFGFGGTGKKSFASQFDDYGEVCVHVYLFMCVYVLLVSIQSFGKDDTVGCYIDLDSFTISFSKNGTIIMTALTHTLTHLPINIHPPHTFTGVFLGKAFDIPKSLHGETFFAAVVLKVFTLLASVVSHTLTDVLVECRDAVQLWYHTSQSSTRRPHLLG